MSPEFHTGAGHEDAASLDVAADVSRRSGREPGLAITIATPSSDTTIVEFPLSIDRPKFYRPAALDENDPLRTHGRRGSGASARLFRSFNGPGSARFVPGAAEYVRHNTPVQFRYCRAIETADRWAAIGDGGRDAKGTTDEQRGPEASPALYRRDFTRLETWRSSAPADIQFLVMGGRFREAADSRP